MADILINLNKTSKNIVDELLKDLSDRSGLGDEWSSIDNHTQKELKKKWNELVETELIFAHSLV